jgi:hypothetical protein
MIDRVQAPAQRRQHRLAITGHPRHQMIAKYDPLHGRRAGAGQRMAGEGMPGQRAAMARPDRVRDARCLESRAKWHVSTAEALGDSGDVRNDAVML